MAGGYDAVICGGGLAGLTLARHLNRALPALSIAVVDRSRRPLPAACHKVGESTVELAAFYLRRELGLAEYMAQAHLPKMGLRYFFGDAQGPLAKRSEFGASALAPLPSYQIDRGILENDLRRMVAESGVDLLEGWSVSDIVLGSGSPHRVLIADKKGRTRILEARWAVDASGRRRLLQTKLGLKQDSGHEASAAWFRMEGRLDIEDFVAESDKPWHARVPGRQRYLSTNHLMGKGYWVWLIPLSSNNTSVGIVADERIHPLDGYATYEKALSWLKPHEPRLAEALAGRAPLDFKKIRRFSYSSRQVFSAERWACVGEAGAFADPFYSPGSDFIAMGNSITVKMIELDLKKLLTAETAERFNGLYLRLFELVLEFYRDSYPVFGHGRIMTAKNVWDWVIYWGFMVQLFLQGGLTRLEDAEEVSRLADEIIGLNRRVQRLFRDWAARVPPRTDYEFLEFFQIPLLRSLYIDLRVEKTPGEMLAGMRDVIARLEELAQVYFIAALEETAPGSLAPPGPPRDLSEMKALLDIIFARA